MKNTRDVFIFKKKFVKTHISLIYKGISGAEILSDRQGASRNNRRNLSHFALHSQNFAVMIGMRYWFYLFCSTSDRLVAGY